MMAMGVSHPDPLIALVPAGRRLSSLADLSRNELVMCLARIGLPFARMRPSRTSRVRDPYTVPEGVASPERIASAIHGVRGHRVMVDADLALLSASRPNA